ncbi:MULTISPECIES: hypothetical protein [unclassified Streptomyces]|uniref:hypothetical protein n=1 Tax=unclassified Streptomyces TaxID=2593676 RepID=UPI000DC52D3E|nr:MULTISPECIES: hypothetical protein [unclassified Streptomyces]MYT72585.1 hypothetical protein [Streptomyces sp. SID8367]RAJ79443.1 hypothetical protein K377_05161 [Streptomyces sp. PsTaAH-137]
MHTEARTEADPASVGPAAQHGPTDDALRAYRIRCASLAVPGAFMLLLATLLQLTHPVMGFWYGGVTLSASALVSWRNCRKIARTLETHSWTRCQAMVRPPRRAPIVVLRDPSADTLTVLRCGFVNQTAPKADGPLWWSGTPQGGGVLSTPGGSALTWAFPAGQHARRRRPVFRWIALLGVLMCALGFAGYLSSKHDPMVELTVVDDSTAPGPCTVSYEDPFTGDRHRGAFVCRGHRFAPIEDTEFGWVVAHGPWRGDLYNADREGTPDYKASGLCFLGGAFVTLIGVMGGAVSRYRRRASRTSAHTLAPPPPLE